MNQKNITYRAATTAIAAVIAISSTPALAQDASVPDPAIEAPAPASDPLAPDPVVTQTPAPPAAEAPRRSKPKVEATTAKPVSTVRRSASTAPTTSKRAATRTASPSPAEPVPAPAAEAPVVLPSPVAAEPAPVAQPITVPQAEPASQALELDETLPIAGAAGFGLLALAGVGLAMRRRRRRREDAEFEANQWALGHAAPEPRPEPVRSEPAFARPRAQEPVHSGGPATALPAGFDLSRFGRHVQAAYRGPTPDNPSLSLKNRLRRASFFDQQERRAARESSPGAAPAPEPAWMSHKPNASEFMFRPAAPKPGLKPALQK
jgi:hypothetical protein